MTKTTETPFILVVDASEEHVRGVVWTLRAAGWNAVGTTDSWEAITLLSQLTVSMVILDLDSTGMGGADFYSILSEDPGLQHVPAVFYSSSVHEPILPRDSDVCLRKPLNGHALLATVRRLLVWPFPPEEEVAPVEEKSSGATRFVRRRRDPQPA